MGRATAMSVLAACLQRRLGRGVCLLKCVRIALFGQADGEVEASAVLAAAPEARFLDWLECCFGQILDISCRAFVAPLSRCNSARSRKNPSKKMTQIRSVTPLGPWSYKSSPGPIFAKFAPV